MVGLWGTLWGRVGFLSFLLRVSVIQDPTVRWRGDVCNSTLKQAGFTFLFGGFVNPNRLWTLISLIPFFMDLFHPNAPAEDFIAPQHSQKLYEAYTGDKELERLGWRSAHGEPLDRLFHCTQAIWCGLRIF